MMLSDIHVHVSGQTNVRQLTPDLQTTTCSPQYEKTYVMLDKYIILCI